MRQWLIDAFANGPFLGNGACVLEPVDAWPQTSWMQALAEENRQAETAFLRRTADPSRFDLRWFTPATEVRLCGHATLAAAHTLFAELALDLSEIVFQTQSGELVVRRRGEGYEMAFPADPPTRVSGHAEVGEALGVRPLELWAGQYLVAIVATESEVRAAAPDLGAVREFFFPDFKAGAGMAAIVAPADAGEDYDVVSRFFAPGAGIPEDPTTGSLHCILAPLFADKLGRRTLRFHQAYPGRGGDLECEAEGERVLLRGRAATVLEGRLRL